MWPVPHKAPQDSLFAAVAQGIAHIFSPAVFAFLVFLLAYTPCVATVAGPA